MLPGLRFLIAAIAMSASILIFGFGAAALLRVAREDFVMFTTGRVTLQPVLAHQADTATPTLAVLRIEHPAEMVSSASEASRTTAPPDLATCKPTEETVASLNAATVEAKPTISKVNQRARRAHLRAKRAAARRYWIAMRARVAAAAAAARQKALNDPFAGLFSGG